MPRGRGSFSATAGRTLPDTTPAAAVTVAPPEPARPVDVAPVREVRGKAGGTRRHTLDLPLTDSDWLKDQAKGVAEREGFHPRDMSAQHLLRAAVALLRPGADGDPWADFRIAVLEQASHETRAVAEATRDAVRDARHAAREKARAEHLPRT